MMLSVIFMKGTMAIRGGKSNGRAALVQASWPQFDIEMVLKKKPTAVGECLVEESVKAFRR
jgi:hypothetical protein